VQLVLVQFLVADGAMGDGHKLGLIVILLS